MNDSDTPSRRQDLPLILLGLCVAALLALLLVHDGRPQGADARSSGVSATAPEPDPAQAVAQGVTARRERIHDLLAQARRLPPERWAQDLSANMAHPPSRLNHDADGRVVVDERLRSHFDYFMVQLAGRVGRDEAASRLLASMNSLPPPERERLSALLEGHLVVEDALDEHARRLASGRHAAEREAAQARLRAALQSDDAHARRAARHAVDQLSARVHAERIAIIQSQGGPEVIRMHERNLERTTRESQLALTCSDPDLDAPTRLGRALRILGLKAQQPLNEPTGEVRRAYVGLDNRAIESDVSLDEASRRQLRLTFFGQAYVAERDRLGGVPR